MFKGLETVRSCHNNIYKILPELKSAMIKLTIHYEQKALNNINKQFQDCIMNYFFEDFVGDIIKSSFSNQTKTQIKENFMNEISSKIEANRAQIKTVPMKNNRLDKKFSEKKYMLLPQKYIQEIIAQKKQQEYVNLLCEIIMEEIRYAEGELRWRSQIRKKTFAALLLVHFYNNYPIQSIFEMWNSTFPDQGIKNQKKSQLQAQTDSKAILNKEQSQVDGQKSEDILKKVEFVEMKPTNNTSKVNTSKVVENRKRKCESVFLNEPKLSKQLQLNHYSKNFPTEIKQSIQEIESDQTESSPLQEFNDYSNIAQDTSSNSGEFDNSNQNQQIFQLKNDFLAEDDLFNHLFNEQMNYEKAFAFNFQNQYQSEDFIQKSQYEIFENCQSYDDSNYGNHIHFESLSNQSSEIGESFPMPQNSTLFNFMNTFNDNCIMDSLIQANSYNFYN